MLFLAFAITFLILWAVVYATLPAIKHIGQVLARLIARSTHATRIVSTTRERYKKYLPVLAILIAGGLLTAWAGDGFIDLAERVHAKNGPLEQTDMRIHDWAISERTSGATLFFTLMTQVGGPVGVAIEIFILSLILAFRRRC